MFSFITKPIGCLFSLVGSIVVIALVLLGVSLWLVANFMPQIGAKAISETTGFPTTVGGSGLSLWSQRLSLSAIRIDNPPNYPERDFISIPSFTLTLDRSASTKEHLVFSDVTLHIDTVTLVRLSGTVLNSSSLISNLLNSSLSAAVTSAGQPAANTAYSAQGEPRLLSPQEAQALIARNQAAAAGGTPLPATGYSTAGSGSSGVHFDPLVPPISADALPTTGTAVAPAGTAQTGTSPTWLIRRLTISIDTLRLFESTPQGNLLQLRPLNYNRTFENVTSLKTVLPHLPF